MGVKQILGGLKEVGMEIEREKFCASDRTFHQRKYFPVIESQAF